MKQNQFIFVIICLLALFFHGKLFAFEFNPSCKILGKYEHSSVSVEGVECGDDLKNSPLLCLLREEDKGKRLHKKLSHTHDSGRFLTSLIRACFPD